MRALNRLVADRRAVTGIEYALIALLIAAIIVTSVTDIGHELVVPFTTVAAKL